MSSNNKSGGNVFDAFLLALTFLFIVLKINPGGNLDSFVADWPWILVFSPILIPFVIGLVGGFIFEILEGRQRKKQQEKMQELIKSRREERWKDIKKE